MEDERRGYPRVYMSIPVEINQEEGSLVHSTAINISQGGMRIRKSKKAISANREVGVRIGDRASLVKMKVCWWHGLDIGCRFLEFMDEHKFAKMIKRLM